MEDNQKIKDALQIWQERELNRAEAMSNADPHIFSQPFIHETLEKMNDAEEKQRRSPKKSIFPSSKISNRTLGMVAMAAVLVLMIIPFASGVFSNLDKDTVKPAGASIESASQGAAGTADNEAVTPKTDTEMASASKPTTAKTEEDAAMTAGRQTPSTEAATAPQMDMNASDVDPSSIRTVSKSYYSVHGNLTTFVDPETGQIYRLSAGSQPQPIFDMKEQMDAHGGLEHFGVQDQTIYVGFNDGRGMIISGDPLQAEDSRYWHKEWFEGNDALPEALKEGLIFGDMKYEFSE